MVYKKVVKVSKPANHKCGSDTGYVYHKKKNEKACEPCRLAHNQYQRDYNSNKK